MYSLRVNVFTTPTFVDSSYVEIMIILCNMFFKESKAPFELLFNASTDYIQMDDLGVNANPQIDPNGFRTSQLGNARIRLARDYPNKIVIFMNQGMGGASGGYSGGEMTNHVGSYVALNNSFLGQVGGLMHELGHYLHLPHVFVEVGLTAAEALNLTYQKYLDTLRVKLQNLIQQYVDTYKNPKQNGLSVFDGDGISDTPPDPGGEIVAMTNAVAAGLGNTKAANLEADITAGKFSVCAGKASIPITVKFADGSSQAYTIQPSKTNIMSYYQACDGIKTISPMQQDVMAGVLARGNRNCLLHMAGVRWPDGCVFFFKGPLYTRTNIGTKTIDPMFPFNIKERWQGWPSGWDAVDAAFVWPGGLEVSFFRKGEHIIYDVKTDFFVGSPVPLAQKFAGWPSSWPNVDAAMSYSHGVFFFRGGEYIYYSHIDKIIKDPPKLICNKWDFFWNDNIDCIITYPSGLAQVFCGDKYIEFDLIANKRLSDVPIPKRGYWPGITPEFDSAFTWTEGKTIFFKGSNYMVFDSILHETIGSPLPFTNWCCPASWKSFNAQFISKTAPDGDNNPAAVKACFFLNNEVIEVDINGWKVDAGYPMSLIKRWPNWPSTVAQKVYSALKWPSGEVFLFVLSQLKSTYMVLNSKTNILDPTIRNIEDFFKVWPVAASWKFPPRAVVANWWEGTKGTIYLFSTKSANEYVKFDVAAMKIVSGYPKLIDGGKWTNFTWTGQKELI